MVPQYERYPAEKWIEIMLLKGRELESNLKTIALVVFVAVDMTKQSVPSHVKLGGCAPG
jgi:hypothetical protein